MLYLIIVPMAQSAFNPLIHDSEPGLSYLGGGRIKMGQEEEEDMVERGRGRAVALKKKAGGWREDVRACEARMRSKGD